MTQTVTKIQVTSHERVFPRTGEAFAVYRKLVAAYGSTSAFLLDSVTDLESRYCASQIGLFPLVTCRVKGSAIRLEGDKAVIHPIETHLQQKNLLSVLSKGDLSRVLAEVQASFMLKNKSAITPYSFGFIGYFAYDAIRYFENIPQTTADDRQLDDILLQIHQVIIHFETNQIRVVINEVDGVQTPTFIEIETFLTDETPPEFKGFDPAQLVMVEDVKKDEFIERVKIAKHHIQEGDIFQIVLSKRDRVLGEIDPLLIYKRLKEVNPSPYMFFVDYGDFIICGASPEMQIRLEQGSAQMRPIAGTTKGKGKTDAENRILIEQLLADDKERAEHLMLVDLCRNDLGRVCEPGSIQVSNFMSIEEYSHVFHIVSTVEGKVEADHTPYSIFLSAFPAGTLTGAPKVRAMELIDQLETVSRGPYGGGIGFFDFLGNMNTAIVIRTIIYQNGISYLQAGAGIVADSIPENEWNECNHKLRVLKETVFSKSSAL